MFFVRYKNPDTSFFHFVTNHAFDGQTDGILIARPRLHSMQRGKKECTLINAAVDCYCIYNRQFQLRLELESAGSWLITDRNTSISELHLSVCRPAGRRVRGGFDEIKLATERKIVPVEEIKRTGRSKRSAREWMCQCKHFATNVSSPVDDVRPCRHCPNSLVLSRLFEYASVFDWT